MKKYEAPQTASTPLADKPDQLAMPKVLKKPGMIVHSGLKAGNPGGR
jgi:hypothetical protein